MGEQLYAKIYSYQTFVYTGSYYDDPVSYTAGPIPTCLSDGELCAIDVPDTDVYTMFEVVALGKPVYYAGKPKVDLNGHLDLGTQLFNAKYTSGETDVTRVNDRLIYEHY